MLKNRVKMYRAALNLSQQDLADSISVARQTISLIEKGQKPSITVALQIAHVLKMPVTELFYIKDAEDPAKV